MNPVLANVVVQGRKVQTPDRWNLAQKLPFFLRCTLNLSPHICDLHNVARRADKPAQLIINLPNYEL